MTKEKKKIWRVLPAVHVSKLEDVLNALADDGYQVRQIEPSATASEVLVVAFDPVELGARSAADMNAALAKVTGLTGP